jgi:hypothetical protein
MSTAVAKLRQADRGQTFRTDGMRDLALAIITGWFWICFTDIGPQTTARQAAIALTALLAGCLIFAFRGALAVRRNLGRASPSPRNPERPPP